MLEESQLEYGTLRGELSRIRDCITTYMGFVLAGAGAGLFTLSSGFGKDGNPTVLAVEFFAATLMMTLVLRAIFYKFKSHNRYAGYCKLLAQELPDRANPGKRSRRPIASWEVCLSAMREVDLRRRWVDMAKYCSQIGVGTLHPERVSREYRRRTRRLSTREKSALLGHWRDWKKFIGSFFTHPELRSWGYPLCVVKVFFGVVASYWLAGGALLVVGLRHPVGTSPMTRALAVAMAVVLGTLQVIWWNAFLRSLWTLTEGHQSVEGYCWAFLPLRHRFLAALGRRTRYEVV